MESPLVYDELGNFKFARPWCVLDEGEFRGPTLLFAILPPLDFKMLFNAEEIPEAPQFKRAVYKFNHRVNKFCHYKLDKLEGYEP